MMVTPTMTYASSTWTLTLKHEKMIKTAQRKMLRLTVQTKRKYKPKKMTAKQKKRAPKRRIKKPKKVLRTKRRMKARSKTRKKIKIATCLSSKMPMKRSTPLKMKRTGSNTSKGAQKKPKNTWEKHNKMLD